MRENRQQRVFINSIRSDLKNETINLALKDDDEVSALGSTWKDNTAKLLVGLKSKEVHVFEIDLEQRIFSKVNKVPVEFEKPARFIQCYRNEMALVFMDTTSFLAIDLTKELDSKSQRYTYAGC